MGKSLNQAKANAVRYTKKKVEHWQVVSLALAGYDAVSIVIAFFLALWFRFDCRYSMIPKEFLGAYPNGSPNDSRYPERALPRRPERNGRRAPPQERSMRAARFRPSASISISPKVLYMASDARTIDVMP